MFVTLFTSIMIQGRSTNMTASVGKLLSSSACTLMNHKNFMTHSITLIFHNIALEMLHFKKHL